MEVQRLQWCWAEGLSASSIWRPRPDAAGGAGGRGKTGDFLAAGNPSTQPPSEISGCPNFLVSRIFGEV